MSYVLDLVKKSKASASELALLSSDKKNEILNNIIKGLDSSREYIKTENKKDIEKGIEAKLSNALIDRLTLTDARIDSMIESIKVIIAFEDPINEVIDTFSTPDNLLCKKVRVPLGVILMIFESRPNVTIDAAALAIKSGNVMILRGGSSAINSNKALYTVVYNALKESNVSTDIIKLVDKTDRAYVGELLVLNQYIDVVIPRGGKSLKKAIISQATIPVIETGAGLCHTYIDASADLDMALDITVNAKVQRPGVCNALETLLIHKDVSDTFLKDIVSRLNDLDVVVNGCKKCKAIVSSINLTTSESYYTEYLDLEISIKIVDSIEEAIEHVNTHSTLHSEAIVSNDKDMQEKFLNEVNSSCVYVNASTRFTDGAMFGFGGEIGISTQKLHARGPMGIKELTSYKYKIYGNGQVRK